MEEAPEGTETTWRERFERSEDLSGQEGCRAESLQKSTVGTEGSGWMAETGNGGEARPKDWVRASVTMFWSQAGGKGCWSTPRSRTTATVAGRTRTEKP